ncbi:MAG: hypothetical protein P0Y59_01145 [Candidatus Sphingomonas phytovorans]|nr:hypothetical protein [Sphingomonas sp.]WEK02684.1 MAG: hypothetical protein P0Y59_01145 [Sphingomonas sp.]
MPEDIVHCLEAIQIEAKDRHLLLPLLGKAQRQIHAIVEQCSIGQISQRIMVRQMFDLEFRLLALGNVPDDQNMRFAPAIFDRAAQEFDRNLTTVSLQKRYFGWTIGLTAAVQPLRSKRQDECRRTAHQPGQCPAGNFCKAFIDIEDSIIPNDQQAFKRRIGQPPEIREMAVEKGRAESREDECGRDRNHDSGEERPVDSTPR